MRNKIIKLLCMAIMLLLLFILPTNYAFKVAISYDEIERYSDMLFWQLDQLMEYSNREIEIVKKNFEAECLKNARIAARIAAENPEIVYDPEQLKEFAELIEVDEIHFFDAQGKLYAGTHPEYYGLTFASGGQIEYFAPMLNDRSLELCQEMMENTAENKIMQYAAAWTKDGKGIVQIGSYPKGVLEIMRKRSLDAIMDLVPKDVRGNTYLVDAATGDIAAAANGEDIIKDIETVVDLSKAKEGVTSIDEVYYAHHKFTVTMRRNGDYIYLNTYDFRYVLYTLLLYTVVLLCYLLLLSGVTVTFILYYLDKRVIRGLESIITELNKIEEGNVEKVEVHTNVPELEVLLYYINRMLQSVFGSFQKFAMVIEKSNIPIGIYEYNVFYNKAFANQNAFDILRLHHIEDQESAESLLRMGERILQIRSSKENLEEQVYRIEEDGQVYYIRLEEFCYEQSNIFWMMDVSNWWDRMELLRNQRNIDVLTNLYNRRAFYELMDALFEQPETLKHAAVIMIDADRLKHINDVYGHQQGDRYLSGIAAILSQIAPNHSICARLGGDEFTMLLYGYDSEETLTAAIQSIWVHRDHALVQVREDVQVQIQFSIGYAVYRKDGVDCQELIHCADERMYTDKNQRKERGDQRQ